MRPGRLAGAAGVALVAALLAPAAASAHGLAGRSDLPIPTYLFGWGAALVLVVSFVGLAVLWPAPRLQSVRERRLFDMPGWVDPLCGVVGVLLFGAVLVSGLAGTATADANLADTFIYVVFWVGLVVVSVLLGDVFRAFNPWRALARGAGWAWGRAGRSWPAPLPYPARLGRWPAVVGIALFAWLELIAADRTDPVLLASLALFYALVQLVGMGLYGVETWSDRGDGFSVYFGLFARLAPLHREGRTLCRRPPLSGAPQLTLMPGTVALVCVMIGSTSYDGLESTQPWTELAPHLESALSFLGDKGAEQAAGTVGLLFMIGIVALLYQLGIEGMRGVGSTAADRDASVLSGRFAHTLIPIAVAYVVAHYFSFLIFNGQAMGKLLSDPLGSGADLLGTASAQTNFNLVSGKTIWYVQVAALIVGHIGGLVLAHDRALASYPTAREATRSQYFMLAVMVGFTSLALWLLASINV